MIEVDGSMGYGQLLRTSISLSLIFIKQLFRKIYDYRNL